MNAESTIQSKLIIDAEFRRFVDEEVLPLTTLKASQFWSGVESLVTELTPINQALLEKRETIQAQINTWHQQNTYQPDNIEAYKQFLQEIGYLAEEGPDFQIETDNVDAEIATMAGPQLVVPIKNARFALNAVNARWGVYTMLYMAAILFLKQDS